MLILNGAVTRFDRPFLMNLSSTGLPGFGLILPIGFLTVLPFKSSICCDQPQIPGAGQPLLGLVTHILVLPAFLFETVTQIKNCEGHDTSGALPTPVRWKAECAARARLGAPPGTVGVPPDEHATSPTPAASMLVATRRLDA